MSSCACQGMGEGEREGKDGGEGCVLRIKGVRD